MADFNPHSGFNPKVDTVIDKCIHIIGNKFHRFRRHAPNAMRLLNEPACDGQWPMAICCSNGLFSKQQNHFSDQC